MPRPCQWIMILLLGLGAMPLGRGVAQDKPPERPELPAGTDTNDATAYYRLAVETIEDDPKEAAAAFYWAARLNPVWAEPLHGRRVALLLKNKKRLIRYMEDDKKVLESPEVVRIDSLAWRAQQRNPFFFREFDQVLVTTYLNEMWWKVALRMYGGAAVGAQPFLRQMVDSLVQADTTLWVRAWRAYGQRQFRQALIWHAILLKDADDKASIHGQRGRLFFLLKQYDSALVSLTQAVDDLRRRDEDDLVIWYESKAMLEYAAGFALEAAGKTAEAREAYARALVEDLAFYPAHVRLGNLGLQAGDMDAAEAEFQLAVETAPDEPLPHFFLGYTYYRSGQHGPAAEALGRVVALEPYYAEPYYMLGLIHEALGDRARAAARYDDFAARAQADDKRLESIARKVAGLRGQTP